MSAVFKPDETFRGDFRYSNSPAAIRRFPLPFPEDNYMYSVNLEPHVPGPKGAVTEFAIDVDEHYVAECRERALVLAEEPLRYQALPHMMSAQWDCLELIFESLARDYPQHFTLDRQGNHWHWINRPLGLDQTFVFGDPWVWGWIKRQSKQFGSGSSNPAVRMEFQWLCRWMSKSTSVSTSVAVAFFRSCG